MDLGPENGLLRLGQPQGNIAAGKDYVNEKFQ